MYFMRTSASFFYSLKYLTRFMRSIPHSHALMGPNPDASDRGAATALITRVRRASICSAEIAMMPLGSLRRRQCKNHQIHN